jgi:hypothetical protein
MYFPTLGLDKASRSYAKNPNSAERMQDFTVVLIYGPTRIKLESSTYKEFITDLK